MIARAHRGPTMHLLRSSSGAALLFAVAALPLASAGAQPATPAAATLPAGARLLTLDNDFLVAPRSGRPTDHEYTHGTALAWAPSADRVIEIGQRLWTPRAPWRVPTASDRPFAGWLYGAVTVRRQSAPRQANRVFGRGAASAPGPALVGGGRVDAPPADPRTGFGMGAPQRATWVTLGSRTTAMLGVTGRASLAANAQAVVHELVRNHSYRFPGWDSQVPTEAAVAVRDERVLAVASRSAAPGSWAAGGELVLGATLGTVQTGAHSGGGVWIASGGPAPVTLRGRVRGEWIGHDITLDGGVWRRSPRRVAHVPVVLHSQVGVGVTVARRAHIEYGLARRTAEYRDEPGGHTYGTFSLTWMPGHSRDAGLPGR